jgi:hypothetical protein
VLHVIIFVDMFILRSILSRKGHEGAQMDEALRYRSTVAGSISYGANEIFHDTLALGSTQPLTDMSTRNISWGVNVAGA